MIKKIKTYSNIRIGDEIMLYAITEKSGMVVTPKFFKITSFGNDMGRYIQYSATRIRKDGSPIRDRWYYRERTCYLRYYKDEKFFLTTDDAVFTKYYIDPKIPCEKVIKKLKEEKQKINKKIIDCQNYMYKLTEETV